MLSKKMRIILGAFTFVSAVGAQGQSFWCGGGSQSENVTHWLDMDKEASGDDAYRPTYTKRIYVQATGCSTETKYYLPVVHCSVEDKFKIDCRSEGGEARVVSSNGDNWYVPYLIEANRVSIREIYDCAYDPDPIFNIGSLSTNTMFAGCNFK